MPFEFQKQGDRAVATNLGRRKRALYEFGIPGVGPEDDPDAFNHQVHTTPTVAPGASSPGTVGTAGMSGSYAASGGPANPLSIADTQALRDAQTQKDAAAVAAQAEKDAAAANEANANPDVHGAVAVGAAPDSETPLVSTLAKDDVTGQLVPKVPVVNFPKKDAAPVTPAAETPFTPDTVSQDAAPDTGEQPAAPLPLPKKSEELANLPAKSGSPAVGVGFGGALLALLWWL